MIAIYILLILLVIFIAAVVVVMVRTARFPRPIKEVEPIDLPDVDAAGIASRLSVLIQVPTVSDVNWDATEREPFRQLLLLLRQQYPRIFRELHVE